MDDTRLADDTLNHLRKALKKIQDIRDLMEEFDDDVLLNEAVPRLGESDHFYKMAEEARDAELKLLKIVITQEWIRESSV